MIKSRLFLLRIRNVSNKVAEKIKTHILSSLTFFFENFAFYEIMWKNMVKKQTDDNKIRRMRFACWLTKATYTCSEYVMLIAFPLQQLFHERA